MTAARLHYVDRGPDVGSRDAAPVVLLGPSLGTSTTMWQAQLAQLARTHRVVCFDHRGHGRSEVPPGRYSIDALGQDVLGLLDSLGIRRASYAGLSLGGMVGMWLAAHARHRVDRLTLLCTSAWLPPPERYAGRAATVRRDGIGAVADAVLARWFTPGFAAARPEVVDAFRAMLLATPAAGYAGCCAAIAAMDLRAELAAVVAPTLVVAGRDDMATPVADAQEIVGRIRGARLVVVDDAAHLAPVEQPDVVTELLVNHLNRLE